MKKFRQFYVFYKLSRSNMKSSRTFFLGGVMTNTIMNKISISIDWMIELGQTYAVAPKDWREVLIKVGRATMAANKR